MSIDDFNLIRLVHFLLKSDTKTLEQPLQGLSLGTVTRDIAESGLKALYGLSLRAMISVDISVDISVHMARGL